MHLLRPAAFLAVAVAAAVQAAAQARTDAPLRLSDAVVGSVVEYTVKPGDSLTSIGARMGVDVSTLRPQNGLDAGDAPQPGQTLTVDNRHVVPGGVSDALVVNIPQRMLFLFGPGDGMRGDDREPLTSVPPAPSSPLGDCWLGLSLPGVGIHGTSTPQNDYAFQTHGCIRLHPDDIFDLFERVALQEHREVIYEPVLMAQVGDRVFLEVHRDVYGRRGDPMLAIRRIAAQCPIPELDWDQVRRVVEAHDGIASDVTLVVRRPDASGKVGAR